VRLGDVLGGIVDGKGLRRRWGRVGGEQKAPAGLLCFFVCARGGGGVFFLTNANGDTTTDVLMMLLILMQWWSKARRMEVRRLPCVMELKRQDWEGQRIRGKLS